MTTPFMKSSTVVGEDSSIQRKIKKVKITNVAATSIDCYHQIKEEGQIEREQAFVIRIMTHQAAPVTSRQLMYLTGKERGNICRSLYNLEHAGIVKVCKTDKCPITNRRVQFYELVQNIHQSSQILTVAAMPNSI
jgi:hypothetical protein